MRDSILSTSRFTYDSVARTFVGEASELPEFDNAPYLPSTITLVSHKTGSVRTFDYMQTARDRDNDVICWEYKYADSCDDTGGDMRLTIYND